MNNLFYGTYVVAILYPNAGSTLHSRIVFLMRNSDFNCFNWINLYGYSQHVESIYVHVISMLKVLYGYNIVFRHIWIFISDKPRSKNEWSDVTRPWSILDFTDHRDVRSLEAFQEIIKNYLIWFCTSSLYLKAFISYTLICYVSLVVLHNFYVVSHIFFSYLCCLWCIVI